MADPAMTQLPLMKTATWPHKPSLAVRNDKCLRRETCTSNEAAQALNKELPRQLDAVQLFLSLLKLTRHCSCAALAYSYRFLPMEGTKTKKAGALRPIKPTLNVVLGILRADASTLRLT